MELRFFSYGVCTEVSSDFGKFQRYLNRKETLTTYFVSIQPLYNGSPSLFFAFVSFTIVLLLAPRLKSIQFTLFRVSLNIG
jgi:hypothetical protein